MEDYFALLELSRDATTEQIDAKIKQQVRTWQRRTTNPDLARRQEAERRVRLLAEAREVLLDPDRRAEYLIRLDESSRPATTPAEPIAAPSSGQDVESWLAQARAYLAKSDHAGALYAAREARRADIKCAEAWALMARANLAMGGLADALTEARRASDLEPGNPGYYFVQGRVHEQRGQLAEANRAYEIAARLNPGAEAPRLAAANIAALGDSPEEALPALEDLFENSADKPKVGQVLANCLVQVAEKVPAQRTGDGYLITSAEEVDAMERLLFRARQVTADRELVQRIETIAGHVKWAKERHVRKLDTAGGCAGVVAAGAALVGVFAFFWFLGDFGPLPGLLALFCLAAAGGYAWWVWTPGHALNRASTQPKAKSPQAKKSQAKTPPRKGKRR
ncbi:MAG: DnaJ domain-containing protein [Streptosporangiales bacterium]|nr:DnaJ domain-containing protein [Streptosporangiales bacterium]